MAGKVHEELYPPFEDISSLAAVSVVAGVVAGGLCFGSMPALLVLAVGGRFGPCVLVAAGTAVLHAILGKVPLAVRTAAKSTAVVTESAHCFTSIVG